MTKKWQKDEYNIEDHPFETYTCPDMRFLIIGTFPTHKKNFRYNFFYSSKDNLFWNVLQEVFAHTFKSHSDKDAIDERHFFLKERRIGITDMHQKCYRKNNLSTDENLFPIILKDIFALLRNNSTIKTIILTSRTEVFGALGLLKTYFLQQQKNFPEMVRRQDKILEGKFAFENREIKIMVPYSPSPRLIEKGTTSKDELVRMYKTCLT